MDMVVASCILSHSNEYRRGIKGSLKGRFGVRVWVELRVDSVCEVVDECEGWDWIGARVGCKGSLRVGQWYTLKPDIFI